MTTNNSSVLIKAGGSQTHRYMHSDLEKDTGKRRSRSPTRSRRWDDEGTDRHSSVTRRRSASPRNTIREKRGIRDALSSFRDEETRRDLYSNPADDHHHQRSHADRRKERNELDERSERQSRQGTRKARSRSSSISSSSSSSYYSGDQQPSSKHTTGGNRSRTRGRSRSPSRDRSRHKSTRRHKEDEYERKERKSRKKKDKDRDRDRDKDKHHRRDKDERRSVLTGKKIKLKVHKDAADYERDAKRESLLQFLNAAYD